MSATYIQLVNRICVRINETTLEEHQFNGAKNIHNTIKNSVADAVHMILQEERAWPFLAIEQTLTLDKGSVEYAWPDEFDTVDWNSFIVKWDDQNWMPLKPIQKEEWYARGRWSDRMYLPEGNDLPRMVFGTHGNGFGVSPNPDKDYVLKYRYWRTTQRMENAGDECRIPQQYEYVITAASLSLMYSFLDNTERASFWDAKYKEGLKAMKRTLLGTNYKAMIDGRVPERGSAYSHFY